MNSNESNIYLLDSDSLITINRYYSKNLFPDLWKILENMLADNKLISHIKVYEELVDPGDIARDPIGELLVKFKNRMIPETPEQFYFVKEIIENFPNLIRPNSEKEQADPWLIAAICDQMEETQMFGAESKYLLVTQESKASSIKIPAVCKKYKIETRNIQQLFPEIGIKFTAKR